MKKILIIFFLINALTISFSKIILPDYNKQLSIPEPKIQNLKSEGDQSDDKTKTFFSFKVGAVDGDLTLFGNWKIKLGFGVGFVYLPPELRYLVSVPEMTEGVIFEQKRTIALDWTTDNGIFLHLFFNDDVNATEYTFKYQVGKIFNSLYLTNKFSGLEVNPYRSLKGGKAQDINFGFDWKTKIYYGRFDLQFDSVKTITDTFRGNKKYIQTKMLSAQYLRGIYYMLPDKNISSELEVYISDTSAEEFGDLPSTFTEPRKYKRLSENTDFKIDPESGYIIFKESVYAKTVLIYYKTSINGNIYEVGNINAGKTIINGTTDFNSTSNPEYFVKHNNKNYLILAFQSQFSYFEEKNSYKIATSGSKVSSLNTDIFDENNQKLSNFSVTYDEYGGSLRIKKDLTKGASSNLYTFIDSVSSSDFYLNYVSPSQSLSKNTIEYACYISGEGLKLSAVPVSSSIKVFLNSQELELTKYTYDSSTQSIALNFEVNETDFIEITYVTNEEEAYNLTAALKNDFRLNDYLMLSDSFWYKMPIKLWEDSYYFRLHSMEFLYNLKFSGDFKKFLNDKKNGKLEFNANATLSVFNPELKGLTLIEDFEYTLTGLKLNLDYKSWFPVSLPSSTTFTEMAATSYGENIFRNLHKYGNKTGSTYISLYDTIPDAESWSSGNTIGPYSSDDGYNSETNTISLITEFNLGANEAISVALPLASDTQTDYSRFSELTAAIKAINLTGDVRLFIDGGAVSEQFNASETTVQTETVDEGIKVLTNEGFYMYKGRSDGVNSSNDFNSNGLLESDTPVNITRFLNEADSNTATNYYVTLNSGYKNIVSYKIENPDRLKNVRALRLTLYSVSGSSGKILFNQLRLAETGWEYDKTKTSTAAEIFPAEDPVLNAHIFSEENSTMDAKLHVSRSRERTMRIQLKQGESFSIQKRFFNPIEIGFFKKIGFFLMLENQSSRILKMTLKDSLGNEMTKEISLSSAGNTNSWKQFVTDFSDFSGYSSSNKSISEIIIDFTNESSDTSDNVIFLDEFYMDETNTLVGFGAKTEFNYSDPGLNLTTTNGFSIFRSPSFKVITGFNTENFLTEEIKPSKNYILNNDANLSFNFLTLDFYSYSYFDFIFKDYIYFFPDETFKLKISRNAEKKLPLLFTFFYDYKKNSTPDFLNLKLNSLNEERRLILELGTQTDFLFFKSGYDIDTIKSTQNYTQSKLSAELKLMFQNINFRTTYLIGNKEIRSILLGNFSLDNLAYLFSEDFLSFGKGGNEKYQSFTAHTNLTILPDVSFSNDINFKHSGTFANTYQIFNFSTDYTNSAAIDVKVSYINETKSFFNISLTRTFEDSFKKSYSTINWYDYFDNFQQSILHDYRLFFYPPFSSIYINGNHRIFGEDFRFNLLSDSLKFIFDWSVYLDKRFFIPGKFIFNFVENISNSIIYTPEYSFILTLSGYGALSNNKFREINIDYFLTENIGIKTYEKNYKTQLGVNFNFYFITGMNFESGITYDFNFQQAEIKKEFTNTISLQSKIYKDFYKKNFVTNDKYGIDMTVILDMSSKFYNRLDKKTEMLDNPLLVYLTPSIGYRFNRNMKITGSTKFGYNMDYSEQNSTVKHSFALEFYLEGVFTF